MFCRPAHCSLQAPEVLSGGALTPASDSFSFGVVMWEVGGLQRAVTVALRFNCSTAVLHAVALCCVLSPAVLSHRIDKLCGPLLQSTVMGRASAAPPP